MTTRDVLCDRLGHADPSTGIFLAAVNREAAHCYLWEPKTMRGDLKPSSLREGGREGCWQQSRRTERGSRSLDASPPRPLPVPPGCGGQTLTLSWSSVKLGLPLQWTGNLERTQLPNL